MQIIRELEPFPRGVYCGAIGWWAPDGRAEFSVAIRTAVVDTENGIAGYSVGSGITWESVAEAEYEECLLKAAVLTHASPEFELLESMRYDGDFLLLREHLDRLAASARYFGFQYDAASIEATLRIKTGEWHCEKSPLKVRVLVSRDGAVRIEAVPAPPTMRVRLGFAVAPVNDRDVFLFHKTTHRDVYDCAKASRPDCDDVLLWNRRGELTESTTANVVLDIDGVKLTPPVRCGLLAGTFRARLLAEGAVQEAVLTKDDVHRAHVVHLINSVRQWIPVEFVG
jgi:para-aminobenzoate synthetase/4-amino-4-deoxychorismate lyase